MGKGTIVSGGANGEYQVQINYNRTRYNAQIARFAALRAALVVAAAAEPDEHKKSLIQLQIVSVDRATDRLTSGMPEDETVAAWCADLTEDLSGEVGTIEVPGELGTLMVQPGFDSNADYAAARDGQVMPTISQDPYQAFYNLAMLPGWQKWKPTFRYATINLITGDTAFITLDAEASSQQNLNINQSVDLLDVPFDYMDCNEAAFSDDDEVLVMFAGQDFSQPKIVGFKDNPKPCGGAFLLVQFSSIFDYGFHHWHPDGNDFGAGDVYDKCFVWDLTTNTYAQIPDGVGGFVAYPATLAGTVLNFLQNDKTRYSTSLFNFYEPDVDPSSFTGLYEANLCNTFTTCSGTHTWNCSDSDSDYAVSETYNGEELASYTAITVSRERVCVDSVLENTTDDSDTYYNHYYGTDSVVQYRNNSDFMGAYLKPNQAIYEGLARRVERSIIKTNDWDHETFYDYRTDTDYTLCIDADYFNRSLAVEFADWSWADTPDLESYDCTPFRFEGYGYRIKYEKNAHFSPNVMIAWDNYEYNKYCVHKEDDIETHRTTGNVQPLVITIKTGYETTAPGAGKFANTDGETVGSYTATNTALGAAMASFIGGYSISGVDSLGRTLGRTDWHPKFTITIYE